MSTLKDKNLKNNEEKKKKVKLEDREDGWDERFYLDKIPPYDAHKDINYLSLGFTKSKIRFLIYATNVKSFSYQSFKACF